MTEFIVQSLLVDAQVSALVGKKVFPQVAPQKTKLPYITWHVISDTSEGCRGGDAGGEIRVQVNAYTETYDGLEQLYRAIKNALHRKQQGNLYCERLNAVDLYRDEASAHGKAIDFQLHIS